MTSKYLGTFTRSIRKGGEYYLEFEVPVEVEFDSKDLQDELKSFFALIGNDIRNEIRIELSRPIVVTHD